MEKGNIRVSKYKVKSNLYFDKIAVNYFDTYDGKYCKLMYEGVMAKIRTLSFKSILDVGCGTGVILSMVLDEYKDIRACGIDLSEKMLEKATEILSHRVQLITGDSAYLPWKDNFFDLVVCNSSFHHYPEPVKSLKEMHRVLRLNGKIIIAEPWWTSPIRFLINWYLKSPFNYGGDVRIYSKREICRLFTECGFESIQWELIKKKYCIATARALKPKAGNYLKL